MYGSVHGCGRLADDDDVVVVAKLVVSGFCAGCNAFWGRSVISQGRTADYGGVMLDEWTTESSNTCYNCGQEAGCKYTVISSYGGYTSEVLHCGSCGSEAPWSRVYERFGTCQHLYSSGHWFSRVIVIGFAC